MRTHTVVRLAAVVALFHAATASAAMIVQESFYVANPANPAMGEYFAGHLASSQVTNQNPNTIGSAGSAWQGSTGVIRARDQGLTYPGASATGGSVRFLHTSSLDTPRSVKRPLTTNYDLDSPVYYISGLMSFDANFSTDTTATAYMSFTNTEDTHDNRSTTVDPSTIILGTQFGFQGDGDGGVNAMMRVRGHNPTSIENVVLASDISPGTHQFVFKVVPNYAGSSPDYVTAWLNPVSLASEAAAGAPAVEGVYSNWVPGGSNPSYIVDTLTLKGWDVGANATVGFDEFRFGTSWGALFGTPELGPPEQHIGFRQGVDGYQHLGAQVREDQPTRNQGDISTMAVGQIGSNEVRSALAFELSDIPRGALITGASLTVTPDSTNPVDTADVGDLELWTLVTTEPMVETEVTWNEISDGVAWNTAGGDLGTLLGTADGHDSNNPNLDPRVFSTEALASAVQGALDLGDPLEMMLLASSTGAGTNFIRFHSNNASGIANRPLLTVTYMIPEPSAAVLLALAALAGLMGRRRSRRLHSPTRQKGLTGARTRTLAMLAAAVVVFHAATASAAMIVQESFYVANPANPAMGEYRTGNIASGAVTNQNPNTIGSVGAAWTGVAEYPGGTGVVNAVSQGLTYPNAAATGGHTRFQHSVSLKDERGIKRPLTADYNLNSSAYYISGLMSFDGNFGTNLFDGNTDNSFSTAYMSFTNTEDTTDNRLNTASPSNIHGVQFGFQGDGADGVNAMMRIRVTGTSRLENVVLDSGISPGAHQFVFKVEPDYMSGSAADRVTVWLNPANLASEFAAGAPIHEGDYSNWHPGDSDPSRIVNTLTLKGWDVGANAAVGFDEFRFGTSWDALFCAPEQHVGFREGVDGYQHLGAQLWEGRTDNQGTISTMAVGRLSSTARVRSVLGWDLSDIPEGSAITGASLTLTSSTNEGDLSVIGDIELYRLTNTEPMVETQVTWDLIRTGTPWDNAGGDYDENVLLGMAAAAANATLVFSTDALIDAVQDSLDQGVPLEMILLSSGAEDSGARNFLRFHSDDASTLTNRPLLTITYVPEPSATLLLALAGMAGLLVRRRRRS